MVLSVGFAIVLLLTIGVGVASILINSRAISEYQDVLAVNVPVVMHLYEIRGYTLDQAGALNRYLVSYDEYAMSDMYASCQNALETITATKNMVSSESVQTQLDAIMQSAAYYPSVASRVIALVEDGEEAEARELASP